MDLLLRSTFAETWELVSWCDPLQAIDMIPAILAVKCFVSMCLHGMQHVSYCRTLLQKYLAFAK